MTATASRRPFRFGAKGSMAGSGREWQELARQAEDLGFASFHVDDHFGRQVAPMPALMAAACATSRILVGPHVAAVDFRNPVVLAKECATIDRFSDGRLILGMGAGWLHTDYEIAGLIQEPALTRIERLGEAISIVRGLWGDGPFSFDGVHYRVGEVDGQPKPVSNVPIMVGGGGEKILSLAAQVADIVGINPRIVARSINERSMRSTAADVIDEKVRLVQDAAGARFADIELQVQVFRAVVTDHPLRVAEELAPRFGLAPEVLLSAPFYLIGTVDSLVEEVQAARERWGISYFVFQADGTLPMAPVVAELAGA